MPVDVIITAGPTPVQAAMSATKRIPIVMIVGSSDPVGEGLVGASRSRRKPDRIDLCCVDGALRKAARII